MATKRSVARSNTNGPDPTEADIDAVEQRIDEGNQAERERADWWKSGGERADWWKSGGWGSPEQEVITAEVVDALPEQVAEAAAPAQAAGSTFPKRLDAVKEDLYRLQQKHRVWFNFPGGVQVFDGDKFSRVKRQMYAAQASEKLESAE